ncbi:gas vesicle structural protein GvpA [Nocardioides sp. NBC_00850]|uniref:gas vesicle protein GvpJ n=1 Tax=Nocardioides sp. NBC_00850 TaxID=2976001 RepID=UPI003866B9C2|nr:gas vesicle structural protein GvpA [Nocardioides sp. NBC_00850]
MTITQQNRYLDRPAPSSLADVIDTILDKGLVIDIYVRVSLVGIELLTIDARIVIASVDTYLRFAEAVNRLDLTDTQTHGIPELIEGVTESGAKGKTSGAIEGAKEKLGSILGSDDEDSDKNADDEEDEDKGRKQPARRPRKSTSRQTKEKED